MAALTSFPASALSGEITPPGDKSISHRALIFGALAVGESMVTGLLESADVLATAEALRAFGVAIDPDGNGGWRVQGLGVGGLLAPDRLLDLGNSGTGVRLLMGLAASHPFSTTFSGDRSLCRRPMQRVITPLTQMGARFAAREGGRLPLTVTGAEAVLPIDYASPVASAQAKSAVLLAGLNAPGETSVREPAPSRDHTENLLRHFGGEVRIEDDADGSRRVSVAGWPELHPAEVRVPGDPSSAAFPAVAALLVPGSAVTIRGVCLNPLRAALFDTLREMGGHVAPRDARVEQGEPVADLEVRASSLQGIEVPASRAPAMIDEYPVLAVAAAAARGSTVMRGLAELRVKESDRIAAMARGLEALGVGCEELADGLVVHGVGGPLPAPPGVTVAACDDHRIAMSFLTYGLGATAPVAIDDGAMIGTSFPGFGDLMGQLGGDVREGEGAVNRP